MRRIAVLSVSIALVVWLAAAPTVASGVTRQQLDVAAGWDCLIVFEAWHCAPPGGLARVGDGSAETMTFLVFSTSNGSFSGTELIVRADIFAGQPCPTDPPSRQYTYLGAGPHDIGLDYYACHHYDSSF